MLSNLSLRGGHRPTWQSRSTRTDHRTATGENVAGCRRFPRRFAPRNDKPVCLTPPNYYCNTCDCLWRSLSAATDAIGAYHFTLTSMGRKCLPEIATGAKRPRNDTSGSAKVHQRPCTVELPVQGAQGTPLRNQTCKLVRSMERPEICKPCTGQQRRPSATGGTRFLRFLNKMFKQIGESGI